MNTWKATVEVAFETKKAILIVVPSKGEKKQGWIPKSELLPGSTPNLGRGCFGTVVIDSHLASLKGFW